MRANGIMANLRVADIDAAKAFYTDFLGLGTEEFNLGWVGPLHQPRDRGAGCSSSRATLRRRRTR
jgi:catechol 2,3-dioxygenase-like lactoylglutathione lyase family enzyme